MTVLRLATFTKLVQTCIQEEGHSMFFFKPSLAECQGRWGDIPWRVLKSFIQVFVVFIALTRVPLGYLAERAPRGADSAPPPA